MSFDPVEFARGMGAMVREAIAGAVKGLGERIEALESRAIPIAEKGDKGDTGPEGKSVTLADVEGLLESAVNKWALEFERRAQGTLERAIDRMPAPKDGRDGENGKDGLGFDDLTVEHDGERAFTFKFSRGAETKEFTFTAPLVIDRGFWRDGLALENGDGVTFGGSYWIAQKSTATKPDTTNPDYRLAVKKGRDGKDGDKGDKGEAGKNLLVGTNGKVLT